MSARTMARAGKVIAAVGAGLLVMAVAPAGQAAPRTARQYQMIELGIAGKVNSLSVSGEAVGGGKFIPGLRHPFLWRHGDLIDLGELTPNADGSGEATDINGRGQVVGYSGIGQKNPPVDHRAFLWQDGTMTALELPGSDSRAAAINDRGQVVGTFTTDGVQHAFLWQHGVYTDLGAGSATDINSRGLVVGTRPGEQGTLPCVWYRGRVTGLPLGPSATGRAYAVNDSGWIVGSGWSETGGEVVESAYLWRSGTVTELGRIGVGGSFAADIDNRGRIVGMTGLNNFSDPVPFLWQRGRMADLARRGVAKGLLLAIDDQGRLGGSMTRDGDYYAVIYR